MLDPLIKQSFQPVLNAPRQLKGLFQDIYIFPPSCEGEGAVLRH